ncbi:MAG: bifunctional acetate--CoA ligase family protein/GNAT family N-acetyltransferase [Neisseriaceae bacterium]|nr:bifunctional acetate--CoA ligase family protein/GNAT family N-acetyltransferase [Neisseriaceae bacterium]
MLQHALHSMFNPQTLAVVGASDRYGTAGRSVFSQLQSQNNIATLIPINPKHKLVGGVQAYESLTDAAKKHQIDGVVVVLTIAKISAVVREAIKIGVKNIVVINELDPLPSTTSKQLEHAAEIAKKANVSLFTVSVHGVEGVFTTPKHTAMAFIGHGEDVADGLKHYANERGIVFSRFLLLNSQNDYSVSTGQLIDYVGNEATTTAVLVHVSTLDCVKELLSALTALAKRKPVAVLSTLIDEQEEALFVQALKRNHILYANSITVFLTAAKLMHTRLNSRGKRMAIISNTPQMGNLIFKTMLRENIEAAQPSLAMQTSINRLLTYQPTQFNPLALPVDASPGLFQAALEAGLNDENIDAILLMYSGRNQGDSQRLAQIALQLQKKSYKPLFLVWFGKVNTAEIRYYFNQNKILHFWQPEHALQAFINLNTYRDIRQSRYVLSGFHDYRYATKAAESVRNYLHPFLSMVAESVSKIAVSHLSNSFENELLKALNIEHVTRHKTMPAVLFHWNSHHIFGQTLTLKTKHQQQILLPPITSEQAKKALLALNLQPENWQSWLLDAGEILNRLPEIQQLQLELFLENNTIQAQVDKCSLQKECTPNVFASYPRKEETLTLKDGQTVFLRAVRPEDANLLREHIENMSDTSRFTRFLSHFKSPPLSLLSRLSNVDYQRDDALLIHNDNNRVLATANYITDANLRSCEFGISICDDLQGQGIGTLLLKRLIQHARLQKLDFMYAEILASNIGMQKLAKKLGFTVKPHQDDKDMLWAKLDL